MPKFISIEQDERGIPIKHTYEAKDGTRYSARYAAVAMAACDGRDGTATLRAAMAQMRAREAHAALSPDPSGCALKTEEDGHG